MENSLIKINTSNQIAPELPDLGDVICADRGLYKHYGIYVGNGQVVHFSSKKEDETNAKDAIIKISSIQEFGKGDQVFIEKKDLQPFSPEVVVSRAKNMIGKCKGEYSLIFNNCEHFANWCKYGEKKSDQVETAAKVGGTIAATAIVSALGYGIYKFLTSEEDQKNSESKNENN